MPWDRAWQGHEWLGRATIWFPPPKLARRTISMILNGWMELPLTTQAVFVIPWVIPAFWHSLSQHLQELLEIHLDDPWIPLGHVPTIPIPLVVLYLPAHVRSPPSPQNPAMEPLALPALIKWHQEQADFLCGLPRTVP